MSVPVVVLIHDAAWRTQVVEHLAQAGVGVAVADDVAELLWQLDHAGERVVCVLENDARGEGRRAFTEMLRAGKGAVPAIFTVSSAPRSDTTQRLLIAGAFAVIMNGATSLPELTRQILRAIDLKFWRYEQSQPWSALAVSRLNRIRDLIMYESYRARASGDSRSLHTLRDIDVALEAVLVMDQFYPWHAVVAVDRYEGNLTSWGRLAVLLANSLDIRLPAKEDMIPYIRRCFPSREYVRLDESASDSVEQFSS